MRDKLTRSTLVYFLCDCREDIQDLDYYFYHFFRHCRICGDVVSLEVVEYYSKVFE